MIVRTPTFICSNGPALPASVTSTGRLRIEMRETSAAETRNEAAFTPNARAGEPSASSTAPIPGPATTTRFSIVPFSAFAATRSSSSTIEGIVAATAGS